MADDRNATVTVSEFPGRMFITILASLFPALLSLFLLVIFQGFIANSSLDSTPMWKQWMRTSGLGQAGSIFFLIGFFVSFEFFFCYPLFLFLFLLFLFYFFCILIL